MICNNESDANDTDDDHVIDTDEDPDATVDFYATKPYQNYVKQYSHRDKLRLLVVYQRNYEHNNISQSCTNPSIYTIPNDPQYEVIHVVIILF